jgi:hypothetical protein
MLLVAKQADEHVADLKCVVEKQCTDKQGSFVTLRHGCALEPDGRYKFASFDGRVSKPLFFLLHSFF